MLKRLFPPSFRRLAAAALLVSCGGALAHAAEAPALTVSLVAPTLEAWPETVPASGWLRPWQEAIIAAEASGLRITELLADVGSVVSKGEPLVRLAQESVLADIRVQQAAIATAKANLAMAAADAERARRLGKSGTLSDQSITERLTREETAKTTLEAEEATLASRQIDLERTVIRAVDDGLVVSRSARLGAVVSPGTELFRLIRQQRVEWQAEVSARHLPRIHEGLGVRIDTTDGPLRGKVRLVGPSVDAATGRAIVYVALQAGDPPRPGLYVTGTIELPSTPALTVPETAIVFRDGLTYVFTVDGEDLAHRVRVETGRRRDGRVEIAAGLDPASRVVAAGAAFLADSVLVRVTGEAG